MNLLQLIGFPLIVVGSLEILLAMVLLKENPRNSPVNKSIATFSFFTGAFSLITAAMYVRASFGLDITGLARANWIGWLIIPAATQFVFYLKDEKSRTARIAGWVLYPFWTLIFFISVTTPLIESGNYKLLPYIDRSGPLAKPLRLIATSGVPVFDRNGAFTGYRGIDRDVTERYELEGKLRYVQKMEAIGRLSGGIAHDLNAIVHSVTGHAELLHLNMKKEDPLRSSIEHILAAADRAGKITRNLLALGDKKELDLKIVKVNDIIHGVEKLLSGLLRENIKLSLAFADEDWQIRADPTQIERVLMNIIYNAVDAMTDAGQLTIESGLAEINDEFTTEHGYGKPGPYAVISVSDTGKGMDDHTRRRIFEPFFTTKSHGKGTGFGLSIVYDIVKEHRGYITLDTVPGKGSRFSMYLPLQLSPNIDARSAATRRAVQIRPHTPDGDGKSSGPLLEEAR